MLSNFSRGLWSGLVATTPMSLFTYSLFRKLSPVKNKNLVLVVHFGYGLLTAIGYSMIAKQLKFKSPVIEGAGFGLSTWAASYGGVTPLFGLHKPTNSMIERKVVPMTAAHVLWGIGLALIEYNLRRTKESKIPS